MDELSRAYVFVMNAAVACFPITTAIMILHLRRKGQDPVGDSVKSKWSIDLDLRFFSSLRAWYTANGGSRLVAALNACSFWVGLIGLVGGMILFSAAEVYRPGR